MRESAAEEEERPEGVPREMGVWGLARSDEGIS